MEKVASEYGNFFTLGAVRMKNLIGRKPCRSVNRALVLQDPAEELVRQPANNDCCIGIFLDLEASGLLFTAEMMHKSS